MALDGDGLLALGPTRFDNVGIDGSLSQKRRPLVATFARLEFGCLGLEYVHEQAANDLALLLWIAHARELSEEKFACIDADYARMQLAFEHVHHHVAFVQAQQAVVDEYAGQPVANGPVNQRRRHR